MHTFVTRSLFRLMLACFLAVQLYGMPVAPVLEQWFDSVEEVSDQFEDTMDGNAVLDGISPRVAIATRQATPTNYRSDSYTGIADLLSDPRAPPHGN